MNHDPRPLMDIGSAPVRCNRCTVFFLLVPLLVAWGMGAVRADWPEFRGRWGNGHVSAPGQTQPIGLPLQWSETNNVRWKTEIPYRGWSTPVVMGGQVWVTTATEDGHDFFAIGVHYVYTINDVIMSLSALTIFAAAMFLIAWQVFKKAVVT